MLKHENDLINELLHFANINGLRRIYSCVPTADRIDFALADYYLISIIENYIGRVTTSMQAIEMNDFIVDIKENRVELDANYYLNIIDELCF